jgi:hypothetical protein
MVEVQCKGSEGKKMETRGMQTAESVLRIVVGLELGTVVNLYELI